MMFKKQKVCTPSSLGEKILELCSSRQEAESLSGDLEEIRRDLSMRKGSLLAGAWYWSQIVRAIFRSLGLWLIWNSTMFWIYSKNTWRNIRRQKIYSFINILGLAVGMACCILILLWIQYEKSYDRFHVHLDQLNRIILQDETGQFHDPAIPGLIPGYLKDEYPDIAQATNLGRQERQLTYRKRSFICQGYLADPDFFQMFTIPILAGNPETALDSGSSLVITKDLAQKLFQEEDALGKVVWVSDGITCKVSGVLENLPRNSSLKFDFLLSYPFHRQNQDVWDWRDIHESFVLLQEGSSHTDVSEKISQAYNQKNPGKTKEFLYLQPMSDVHLRAPGGGGLITYITIFSFMAGIILLIACINFMNLSTACSEKRLKEIGIKKVVGSSRAQLIRQFLSEYMFMSFLSLFLALLLVQLLLPSVGTLIGQPLNLRISWQILLYFVGIAFITGIISGAFPALILSSFRPVSILRGRLPMFGTAALRRILVVTQFSLSILFIISALVIARQMEFIRNKDLGFGKDQVVHVPVKGYLKKWIRTIKNQLLENPSITGITASSNNLVVWDSSMRLRWETAEAQNDCIVGCAWVDHDFIKTLEIGLADGRFYSREFPSDTRNAYVLNEAAVQALGMTDPIGQTVIRAAGTPWADPGMVIGVVKDFHTQSLHERIKPFVLILSTSSGMNHMWLRIHSQDISGILGEVEASIREIIPNYPVTFQFLDEMVDRLYQYEQITKNIIRYIMVIAIVISCLGLLGLASFSVELRTKEIGIRKTLGASVPAIALFFLKDFIRWVILANLFAWPLAWYVLQRWLQRFAYRTDMGWHLFVLAGFLALLTAVATVCAHSIKAARADPVESLRYE